MHPYGPPLPLGAARHSQVWACILLAAAPAAFPVTAKRVVMQRHAKLALRDFDHAALCRALRETRAVGSRDGDRVHRPGYRT
jgi:hypothetical protein